MNAPEQRLPKLLGFLEADPENLQLMGEAASAAIAPASTALAACRARSSRADSRPGEARRAASSSSWKR